MTNLTITKLCVDRNPMPLVIRPGFKPRPDHPPERGLVAFLGLDGRFASGYWECEPGELALDNYPVDELCVLLEGEITIVARTGETLMITPGDAFVIPRGFNGAWKISRKARKLFACAGDQRLVAAITGVAQAR